MTKDDVRYLLKHLPLLPDGTETEKISARNIPAGRETLFANDEKLKRFVSLVPQALETLEPYDRRLIEQAYFYRHTDLYIIAHSSVARSTFYRIKSAFINQVHKFCIFADLVSWDEIKKERCR